jgi:hypothetical protein
MAENARAKQLKGRALALAVLAAPLVAAGCAPYADMPPAPPAVPPQAYSAPVLPPYEPQPVTPPVSLPADTSALPPVYAIPHPRIVPMPEDDGGEVGSGPPPSTAIRSAPPPSTNHAPLPDAEGSDDDGRPMIDSTPPGSRCGWWRLCNLWSNS